MAKTKEPSESEKKKYLVSDIERITEDAYYEKLTKIRKERNLPLCGSIHFLKTRKVYFKDYWNESRGCSVRKNDRRFKRGDIVFFREYFYKRYTGPQVITVVTNVLKKAEGIKRGYCVLSFEPLAKVGVGRETKKLK